MNILGIETSCDETAAAVVRDGRAVLSSVVFSQIRLHAPYGGVVPEIASRNHVQKLPGVVEQALAEAGVGWDAIDGVAVTYGPGLASSLLVGLSLGKALAMRLGKPLIGINHLEAHLYSIFLGADVPSADDTGAFLALLVSGGHSCLVHVQGPARNRVLGQTLDDAAGEAFDKGANLLRLGYPGGPAIDKASREGRRDLVKFPRSFQGRGRKKSDAAACAFSFSGVKTALLYYLRDNPETLADLGRVRDVAASYQEAIVDSLLKSTGRALQRIDCSVLAVVGGVSLNARLREKAAALAARHGRDLRLAEPRFCADNAAMVAGLAGAGEGVRGAAAFELDAEPNLTL
ncbi:MAG: tRNA (adenosine(37)-N6)-threonylcarbamoyltransferase complex transferase subunit TsaD [Kiritimatiellae bacterium]|nr:tRNA (adenosine(37)-N6)-threonylcarbamoyltransferase complex transferase subunit TsaD [Kiritimatiellia bacterium]